MLASPTTAAPAQAAAAAAMPSAEYYRPSLAPEVRLVGEMPDVGFRERQWLVERSGHFVQVTELLYRVLEQIDGARTVADIARGVTATTEWALEPEHVDYLIAEKLRPLGLVIDPNGEAPSSEKMRRDESPLGLAMRLRTLPPAVVEPLANALRYLYAPPVLAAVCLTIAIAHWWLYATYSVSSGLQAAFYAPGGLLAVLALGIIAGLFHELGHAAALRYGGGRSRGIGVGLYLMFPAFFSDVTDSYRLPRGARVRTDLGGIYFHLIFATVLIALAAQFDTQFLIAAVLAFNVEAFRQLMPFVRLDGYWLLADLTGVPDFFSQMKAFARSVAPGTQSAGTVLPAFKPWVRIVFALYVLSTIPVLIWLLALTVLYVPELASLTRQALAAQVELFAAADNLGTRLLVASQMALIPIPLMATSYFLLRLLVIGLRQFAWERVPAPMLRVAGATGVAAAAAAVALFVAGGAVPQPVADEARALGLLRSVERSTREVGAVQAGLRGVINAEPFTGRVTLRRPNLARVDIEGSESVGRFTVVSDGSDVYVYFPAANRFTKAETADDGRNIDAFIVDQVRGFFRPDMLLPREGETATYAGRKHVDGAEYDVVEVESTGRRPATVAYHISTADGLVHRVDVTTWRDGKPATRWAELTGIRLDGQGNAASFAWAPPADAQPLTLAQLGVELP